MLRAKYNKYTGHIMHRLSIFVVSGIFFTTTLQAMDLPRNRKKDFVIQNDESGSPELSNRNKKPKRKASTVPKDAPLAKKRKMNGKKEDRLLLLEKSIKAGEKHSIDELSETYEVTKETINSNLRELVNLGFITLQERMNFTAKSEARNLLIQKTDNIDEKRGYKNLRDTRLLLLEQAINNGEKYTAAELKAKYHVSETVINRDLRQLVDHGRVTTEQREQFTARDSERDSRLALLEQAIKNGESYSYDELSEHFRLAKSTAIAYLRDLMASGAIDLEQRNNFVLSSYARRNKADVVQAIKNKMPADELIDTFKFNHRIALFEYITKRCPDLLESDYDYLKSFK